MEPAYSPAHLYHFRFLPSRSGGMRVWGVQDWLEGGGGVPGAPGLAPALPGLAQLLLAEGFSEEGLVHCAVVRDGLVGVFGARGAHAGLTSPRHARILLRHTSYYEPSNVT